MVSRILALIMVVVLHEAMAKGRTVSCDRNSGAEEKSIWTAGTDWIAQGVLNEIGVIVNLKQTSKVHSRLPLLNTFSEVQYSSSRI